MRYRIDDLFYSHHSLFPKFFGKAYFTYIFRVVSYLCIAIFMDWTITIRHPANFIFLIVVFLISIFVLLITGLYLCIRRPWSKGEYDKPNYYMQFPNIQGGESSQVVMSMATSTANSQSRITYKLNVSSSQAPGAYQNSIKYIAIPSL